ncbi:MAG TPA: DoxX family protein [Gemmatimonadales bacterium]|nr:DoxX family protein [Gemmatimonadales bacterium]
MVTSIKEPKAATGTGKGLRLSLWIVQVILAAWFGMAGVLHVAVPIAQLAPFAPWTADVSPTLVRFIGVAELAGAVGVILPALTGILPMLTPLAAAGLALVMALAIPFHVSRGEPQVIPMLITFAALGVFVAWGRSRRVPIQSRQGKSAPSRAESAALSSF